MPRRNFTSRRPQRYKGIPRRAERALASILSEMDRFTVRMEIPNRDA